MKEILLRRVALLCCHCLRNLAFYRSGWSVGSPIFKGQFLINANSNFLDISVLEWCKLFGDVKGKYNWRKVISNSEYFYGEMLNRIEVNEIEFNGHMKKMRTYRDKFIAHLDSDPLMHIPELDISLHSVSFLYDYLIANEGEPMLFVDAPKNAASFYTRYFNEGKETYLT